MRFGRILLHAYMGGERVRTVLFPFVHDDQCSIVAQTTDERIRGVNISACCMRDIRNALVMLHNLPHLTQPRP